MIDHELAQQLYNDGRGAFETGDVARAIHSFQQSAAVFPHFKTLELLGEALLQSGNALAAVAPLAAATALNAQVRAPSLLAEAFLSLGEIEDAREFAADVITRDPGNRRARRVLDAIGGV